MDRDLGLILVNIFKVRACKQVRSSLCGVREISKITDECSTMTMRSIRIYSVPVFLDKTDQRNAHIAIFKCQVGNPPITGIKIRIGYNTTNRSDNE
jgi:hypothetical protein